MNISRDGIYMGNVSVVPTAANYSLLHILKHALMGVCQPRWMQGKLRS